MISGVASKDIVEFDVVDFIVSLRLEPLEDDFVLLITYLQLHVVKDGLEASVSNESALALVFILEEGLDQESLVADEPAESLHATVKDLLLFS